MSSVARRIIIEEYISGGYGIFDSENNEAMGLTNEYELLKSLFEILDKSQEKKK